MSRLDIFLLDDLNNIKDEIIIAKPNTYQELLTQFGKNIKNLPKCYELYIIGKNSEELKIDNEDKYNKIEDILFLREINQDILQESLFEINKKKLSESQQDKLEEKYNCILCSTTIKNENPYLCYQCQKKFHIKCLDDWDKKCKQENKIFSCPNCRKELPKEKWKKKIDFEGSRIFNANLINKMNELKLNNNMNNNINIIKDKKINELKDEEKKQNEIIQNYEKYIIKTIDIFKNILNKINTIHHSLNLPDNNKLNDLIKFYPLKLQNLYIDNISNIINEELDLFNNNNESHKKYSFVLDNKFSKSLIFKDIQPIIQQKIQQNITVHIHPTVIELIQPIHIPNAKQYGITGLLKFDEFKSKNIIPKEQLIFIEEIFKDNERKFYTPMKKEILEKRTIFNEYENLQKVEVLGEIEPYTLKILEYYNTTILEIEVRRENRYLFKYYVDIF